MGVGCRGAEWRTRVEAVGTFRYKQYTTWTPTILNSERKLLTVAQGSRCLRSTVVMCCPKGHGF